MAQELHCIMIIVAFLSGFIAAFFKDKNKRSALEDLRDDLPLEWIVTEDDEIDGN